MAEPTERDVNNGADEPAESVMAAAKNETPLTETFGNALKITHDDVPTEFAATEWDELRDGETVCPPPAEISNAESEWVVGAPCEAVWSEDGQVYSATVLSLDGERCRVRFSGYGNEDDVELSELRRPKDAAPEHGQSSEDWSPGSPCCAAYSEDGLIYPAVVLWVKGQRCRVRFDDYNNEEELDVSGLLSPDELNSRATEKGSSVKSSSKGSNSDRRRGRREEVQGERRGERRSAWRDNQQNSSWREKTSNQSRADKEAEAKRRGGQQRDEEEKPANHSFSLFPPFPPQSHFNFGNPLSFVPPPPPPPPPVWTSGGKESWDPPEADATSSMLMLWYACGFHTGSYVTQQRLRSTAKD